MMSTTLFLLLTLLPLYNAADCYDTLCHGTDDPPTIIPCDQSAYNCTQLEDGTPICNPTPTPGEGEGVTCLSENFYCAATETGAALCVYATSSCYNNKCQGRGAQNTTYIDCDESANTCGFDDDSDFAVCIPGNPGLGVNCTVSDVNDQFYCQNDLITGVAECVYPHQHSCYDTTCTGIEAFNKTVIDCDQNANRCGFNATGGPICIDTTRGAGVDCSGTEHEDFYCNNGDTGAAVCVATPPSSCYNTKCGGTGDQSETLIDCDESANLCQVDETGAPLCVPLSRGAGVNCTTTEENDEFYCQNDITSGLAECVYPPVHDCYESTCTGIDAFNTTVIDCDQSSNRCGFNASGAPVCIDTTRGAGSTVLTPLTLTSIVVQVRSVELNVSSLHLRAVTVSSVRALGSTMPLGRAVMELNTDAVLLMMGLLCVLMVQEDLEYNVMKLSVSTAPQL